METKTREVQSLVQESWQRFERNPNDTALIQPVKKGAQAEKTGVRNERRPGSAERATSESNPGTARELAEQVQQFLEEVKIQLNFEVHDETGELVVQVVNHENGEVIRQIPPDELIELREKLVELRGVLFNDRV